MTDGIQHLTGYVMRDRDELIATLRQAQISRGPSQDAIAKRVSLSRPTVSAWLSGVSGRLHSADLLSKYGDEPDAWLDWCDERGIDYNAPGWNWHAILRRLVREHLLPKLDQRVEVYDIDTIHNPIRASTVDGAEIDDRAHHWPGTLTPEAVEVPYSEVLRIAQLVAQEAV